MLEDKVYMKKITGTALVLALLTLFSSAMAASTITESFSGNLYHRFSDGSMKLTSQRIATATHSYLIKNNTSNLYSGATDQGTRCTKGTNTTEVTISSQPNFSVNLSSDRKKITVKYSNGSLVIRYHDMLLIDANGNQTISSDICTSGHSFNASKTHSK